MRAFSFVELSSIEPLLTGHFSENWGLINFSPVVAGNIYSMIFGRIFDAHSSHTARGIHCHEGVRCYSSSRYVTAFGCFCALILALVAAKRDRRHR